MTKNKAKSLLVDWAMSKVDPDALPSYYSTSVLMNDHTSINPKDYRTDRPLIPDGKLLMDYRTQIDRLLNACLLSHQLEAVFLYYVQPKATQQTVADALSLSPFQVRRGIERAVKLLAESDI